MPLEGLGKGRFQSSAYSYSVYCALTDMLRVRQGKDRRGRSDNPYHARHRKPRGARPPTGRSHVRNSDRIHCHSRMAFDHRRCYCRLDPNTAIGHTADRSSPVGRNFPDHHSWRRVHVLVRFALCLVVYLTTVRQSCWKARIRANPSLDPNQTEHYSLYEQAAWVDCC